jgi:hypothetical protein
MSSFLEGQEREKIENRRQRRFDFSLLPFQTPTRLADGLGPGSALFPATAGKYAPNIGSPASILTTLMGMDLGCYMILLYYRHPELSRGPPPEVSNDCLALNGNENTKFTVYLVKLFSCEFDGQKSLG